MIKSGQKLISMVIVPVTLVLATSGCASKKYVRNQVSPVNQKVSHLEAQTNERIAYLNNKEQSDISQVNERISTTDQRVTQVASAVQEAQGTASRAMDEANSNSAKIAATSTAVNTLESGVANALNYQLVEKADVTFAFNKSTLTPEAKTALDEVAQKMQSLPRAVVELVGFTDQVGSKSYNIALSRKRAESVQRYLVMQKVAPRDIKIVGLGEEPAPANLEADLQVVDPNPSKAELPRLARRVHIRVYGAGDITKGSAGRSQ
jgi:outer membrane protein OmpA-like peptidoglycan-associated protein